MAVLILDAMLVKGNTVVRKWLFTCVNNVNKYFNSL